MPQNAPVDAGESFVAIGVDTYTSIMVRGLRYGITHKHCGAGYRLAYIENRQPVRIAWIYHIRQLRRDPHLPPLEHTCAIVQLLETGDDVPIFPWQMRCVTVMSYQKNVIPNRKKNKELSI